MLVFWEQWIKCLTNSTLFLIIATMNFIKHSENRQETSPLFKIWSECFEAFLFEDVDLKKNACNLLIFLSTLSLTRFKACFPYKKKVACIQFSCFFIPFLIRTLPLKFHVKEGKHNCVPICISRYTHC